MMEKERVFIVCALTTLLTLTVVVAGCVTSTSNNNASTMQTQRSENVTMTPTTNASNVTHGEPIKVAQGQDFTVTLRSNPSTGYHWEAQFDNATLTLKDSTFISDPNPYNLVGVPGSQVFTFQGLVKGTTVITFLNISPSQIVTEQTFYSVTVT